MKKRIYIPGFLVILFSGILSLYFIVFRSSPHLSESSYSIKNDQQITNVELEKISRTNYLLLARIYNKNKLVLTNSWHFDYEVFRIDTGDINNDKSTDIFVGVIKPTRFDPVLRKRLFIFKLYEGYIRPLWLGSRVSRPLIDFKFVRSGSEGVVRTIEAEADQSCLVAEYRWSGFGLGFIRYLSRGMTSEQAYNLLNTKTNETKGHSTFDGIRVHRNMGVQAITQQTEINPF